MQVLLNVCGLCLCLDIFILETQYLFLSFLILRIPPWDGRLWDAWSLELSSGRLSMIFSSDLCMSVCFLPRSEKWARLLLSDALELRAVLVDLPLIQRSVSSPSPAPRPTCWSKSTASPCPWAWRSTASLNSIWFRFAQGFILCQSSRKLSSFSSFSNSDVHNNHVCQAPKRMRMFQKSRLYNFCTVFQNHAVSLYGKQTVYFTFKTRNIRKISQISYQKFWF